MLNTTKSLRIVDHIIPKFRGCTTTALNNWRKSFISNIDSLHQTVDNPLHILAFGAHYDRIINTIIKLNDAENTINIYNKSIKKLYENAKIKCNVTDIDQTHLIAKKPLNPLVLVPEFSDNTEEKLGEWRESFIRNIDSLTSKLKTNTSVSEIQSNIEYIFHRMNELLVVRNHLNTQYHLLQKLCFEFENGDMGFPNKSDQRSQNMLNNTNNIIPEFNDNSKVDLDNWREDFNYNLIGWQESIFSFVDSRFYSMSLRMWDFDVMIGNIDVYKKLLKRLQQTRIGTVS